MVGLSLVGPAGNLERLLWVGEVLLAVKFEQRELKPMSDAARLLLPHKPKAPSFYTGERKWKLIH